MKKYLAIFAVLFTVILSSCSNDDIPVQDTTVIRVNPSTVMSNFTYQLNPGDLDGVNSDQELRIRLFIYDGSGKLVNEQTQSVRNYLTTATFEVDLPRGEYYKAIAITDVTSNKSGNVAEYWGIEETSDLSSLRINYLGNEGNYGDQEILGVKSETFESGQNTTINVEAAGALVCTWVRNLHAYSNIQYIWVWGNRGNGFYDFSTEGSLNSNPVLEVQPDFTDIDVDDFNYNVYSYKFIMPQTNYKLTLTFADNSGSAIHQSEKTGLTLKEGCEYLYLVYLDPEDDGSGNYYSGIEDVTGQTYGSSKAVIEGIQMPSEYSLFNSTEKQKSWKIKELLK